MTFPGYSGGAQPGGWGLSANGSIPGMGSLTQGAVTDRIAGEAMQGSSWPGLGGMLVGMILSLIAGAIGAVLGGFATIVDAIFGTVNDDFVSQLPTINDHSQSITELQAAFNQLILQGNAIVFTSNNTYTPSDGIVSIDVIMLGAGAGGAAGRWDIIAGNRRVGSGGGGGGEVHTTIPASLLPMTGGHFDPISIVIGAGGAGGTGDAQAGTGGGNTSFGSYLTAGGGVGGLSVYTAGANVGGGGGGAGMIVGGAGGGAGGSGAGENSPFAGGNSISGFSLNGGGGGGGGGMGFAGGVPAAGGIGGISPGGTPGNPGSPPSDVVATGGGGGGGSSSGGSSGAGGAIPAGGGGGGGGDISARGNGGNGARGQLFVIERMS